MSNPINLKELFKNPEIMSLFRERSPAHQDLDAVIKVNDEDDVVMELPYSAQFATESESFSLHPGVVMTAMDSAMGLAMMISLEEFSSIATLELRYDQIRPSNAHSSIVITACFGTLHDGIAYLTAKAEDNEGTFSKGTARFILTPATSSFMETALSMLDENGISP